MRAAAARAGGQAGAVIMGGAALAPSPQPVCGLGGCGGSCGGFTAAASARGAVRDSRGRPHRAAVLARAIWGNTGK